MRWRRGGIWFVLAAVLTGGVVLAVATPTGRFVARAAWEEGRILARRRPIERIVADTTTDAVTRGKLQVVLDARRWAADSLGFPAKGSFSAYSAIGRDTLVLVLSAARADSLVAHTWWFPVVGRVPYKGYFDVDGARRAERALQREGLDTYLRPSPAFSTLGWFDDPLLSTSLVADSVDLVNTVIHELTHNRYYAAGDAVFNESLANWVGARGAERFFAVRGDSASAARVRRDWEVEQGLARFWESLATQVERAFSAHPGPAARAARLAARDSVYAAARRTLVDSIGPTLGRNGVRWAERVVLNNAALLARRAYLSGLDGFDAELAAQRGALRPAVDTLIARHRAAR